MNSKYTIININSFFSDINNNIIVVKYKNSWVG